MFDFENQAKISHWLEFTRCFAVPVVSLVGNAAQVGALLAAAHIVWPVLLWRLSGLAGSLFSMRSAWNQWCAYRDGGKVGGGKNRT